MASTAHRIFTLLGIDANSPQAEAQAKARLASLGIHGRTCRRCGGSGRYADSRAFGAVCFNCNGHGATGIALSKLALQQLEARHENGSLSQQRRIWRGQDMLQQAQQELRQRCQASGIEGLYNSYDADQRPVGDWNRDLADIHAKMRRACVRLAHFPGAQQYAQLSPAAQETFHLNFQRAYRYAQQRIDEAKAELEVYRATHTQPDFRRECLAMVGLLTGS